MHLLRVLLVAWLEFGIVTVFFLFWLCKRTTRQANTVDKPVLDQDTFQQLLAAAYTLQEQDRLGVKEAKAESSQTVSLSPGPVPIASSDVEPLASLNDSAVPRSRDRRMSRSDEFFWRVAAAVVMAAVFALVLVTSLDRLSPLPARLEVVRQDAPFPRVQPQNSGVATKTIGMEPDARATERPVVVDKPPATATPGSFQKRLNPKRYSAYESESDIVAQDTVVRYGRRGTPR